MRRLYDLPRKRPKLDNDENDPLFSNLKKADYQIALIRAPIMPLLLVEEGPKILFQAFKSPLSGHTPGRSEISLKKTLGCKTKLSSTYSQKFSNFKSPPSLTFDDPSDYPQPLPLVLFTPNENNKCQKAIEVDPILTRWLREHQRQGVQFIFDCLMGIKDFEGEGCILADDMGLGKTLQSITILWTLLKQGFDGKPAIRRCLIVCPASLVNNWSSEIEKWLKGKCPCTPVADSSKDKVVSKFLGFRYDNNSKVLISSYETFRMHVDKLEGIPIDLIICDEAHRLKNERTKTAIAISKLPARKRLLLSGTPIQNDLDEFYAMISLCNPDIMGGPHQFRKLYINPILQGREPGASEEQQLLANQRLNDLSQMTNLFVLRRTNNLLSKVLPPKILMNIFCRLTPLQTLIYQSFLDSKSCKKILQNEINAGLTGRALSSIQGLMKLCNHPLLLRTNSSTIPGFEVCDQILDDTEKLAKTARARLSRPDLSGKLLLVTRLLHYLKTKTNDKVVIISNFTQTLDLVDRLCRENNYPVTRLDGSTSIKKRHSMVNDFNNPQSLSFVFLLSSKAGGCGINLIGANRLIMYDPDWNPANDKQALARIWRDGQKKSCFIYRLFSTGTIEEKVYQRQICKEGLSTMLMREGECQIKDSISAEMLKDLFTLRNETVSDTHDMLGCFRCPKNAPNENSLTIPQLDNVDEDDLITWAHHHDIATAPDIALTSSTTRKADFPSDIERQNFIPQLSNEDFQPVSFVMSCVVKLHSTSKTSHTQEPDKTPSDSLTTNSKINSLKINSKESTKDDLTLLKSFTASETSSNSEYSSEISEDISEMSSENS